MHDTCDLFSILSILIYTYIYLIYTYWKQNTTVVIYYFFLLYFQLNVGMQSLQLVSNWHSESRIDHRFHGRLHPYPWIHRECPCLSKTWNGLQKHLFRNHPFQEYIQTSFSFRCYNCDNNQLFTECFFFQ